MVQEFISHFCSEHKPKKPHGQCAYDAKMFIGILQA